MRTRLSVGLYYTFIKDWLELFSSDQVHILRFEDYIVDRLPELQKVFAFLGLCESPIFALVFLVFYHLATDI